MHEGIYTVDTRARLTFVNARLAAMLGVARETLLGRSIFRFVLPTDRGRAVARWRRPGRPGEQWEMRLLRPDGGVLWTLASGLPLHDDQGTWLGTLGLLTDISARKELEERLWKAEAEKQVFYRQVLQAVTRGRFHLVDELPRPPGPPICEVALDDRARFRELVGAVEELARREAMSRERCADFLLAVGEAVGNAIKHGGRTHPPRGQVFRGADRVSVRVTDRGPGIRTENLPASLLKPGFSTAVSLGMGYTLMLELSDGLWLATGVRGTALQLEKLWQPADDGLASLLERF